MTQAPDRYGAQRVRRSLLHFVLGKSAGALIGLAWLFTLVRVMPEADYGAYFTFYAYIEVMLLLSAWGSVQLMERFVPELHEQHRDGEVARLASALLRWRGLLLIGTVALLQWAQRPVLGLLGLQDYAQVFWLINGLLLAEGLCRMVDSFHEGLLMQRKSQFSVLFRNGIKTVTLLYMTVGDQTLSLQHWLQLELGLMALALLWSGGLFLATRRNLLREAPVAGQALDWRRYWRYGLYIFGCQLVWLLTSFDTLKIAVTRGFGLDAAALLGFCLALVLVVQRYLPTYLLAGMARPLFIVARQRADMADRLRQLSALFFKLNLAPLLPLLLLSCLYEDRLLQLSSGGKFDAGGGVLSLLLALLIVQALKNCQALVITALEDGQGALLGSVVAVAVFGGSALLLLPMGVQGLLLALLLAELASLAVQHGRIARQGVRLGLPLIPLLKLAVANGLALGLTMMLARASGLSAALELGLALLACGVGTLAVLARSYFDAGERARLAALLPAGLGGFLGRLTAGGGR